MTRRIGWSLCVMLLLLASFAWAQASKPKSPPPPFQLTAEEERTSIACLDRWEQWNSRVKTFQCRFKRWTYDAIFGSRPTEAKFIELGTIKYARRTLCRTSGHPGRDGRQGNADRGRPGGALGLATVSRFGNTGRRQATVDGVQAAARVPGKPTCGRPARLRLPHCHILRSCCLGFSLEHRSSASPFPFAAKAEELKQQYYIRTVTPADEQDRVWLEAFPRSHSRYAARLCQKMVLIFAARDMSPYAMTDRAAEREGLRGLSVLRRFV